MNREQGRELLEAGFPADLFTLPPALLDSRGVLHGTRWCPMTWLCQLEPVTDDLSVERSCRCHRVDLVEHWDPHPYDMEAMFGRVLVFSEMLKSCEASITRAEGNFEHLFQEADRVASWRSSRSGPGLFGRGMTEDSLERWREKRLHDLTQRVEELVTELDLSFRQQGVALIRRSAGTWYTSHRTGTDVLLDALAPRLGVEVISLAAAQWLTNPLSRHRPVSHEYELELLGGEHAREVAETCVVLGNEDGSRNTLEELVALAQALV